MVKHFYFQVLSCSLNEKVYKMQCPLLGNLTVLTIVRVEIEILSRINSRIYCQRAWMRPLSKSLRRFNEINENTADRATNEVRTFYAVVRDGEDLFAKHGRGELSL